MWGSDKVANHSETLISSKSEINGDIKLSGGRLNIEGKVVGNIFGEEGSNAEVNVAPNGMVEGEIRAPKITVHGAIKGNLYSAGHIGLAKKATVTGNVHYATMEMEMGAEVNGNLVHEEAVKGKRKASDASAESVTKTQTANT